MRKSTKKATPVIQWQTPLTPEPWTVEEHAPERDLWMVRTSVGLVIGPIFGGANAHAVAGAPAMLEALRHAETQIADTIAGYAESERHEAPEKTLARIRSTIDAASPKQEPHTC